MQLPSRPTTDAVTLTGLSVLLDEDAPPPYLELGLEYGGKSYRAAVLAVEEEWALHLRDVTGKTLLSEPELYPTQGAAVLAALVAVLSRSPP